MNKTNNTPNNMKKVKRGLRKKVYAALSMLLVCTTLLTTATYAWLSLSVAPSVEKVKTTITGNGSLEIALATTDVIKNLDLIDDFESLTGFDEDGNYNSKANANWGNLVDLSDDKYGLSLLKLYPALLNIVGNKVGDNPLKVANFGADGRVTFLNADTTSAMYDTNTGAFLLNGTGDYGVRALGVSTATGLWDALETALRATARDADNLLKEKVSVTLSGISTDASIAQYIEFMSLADANGQPTVKSLINIAEKILGTDPVEATESTPAVEGVDGMIDKLDTAVRNLILASSGYSDKYVSISADEMLEKVESDVSTVELIENYVLKGTDLAKLCDYYMIAANRAEELQGYYEVLLTKPANEKGTHHDLEVFGAPIFGDSFKTYFTAWINRTVLVEKTVETIENGQTVEKTVTETVVTHEGEIISAPTLAEIDAMITALGQPADGEKEVVSCTASNKTKNIEVLGTDNLLSAMAQIAGTLGSTSTSVNVRDSSFFGKPLMIVVPCTTEKCAIDQLSSVEKEFAYQESLYTLQSMWNELDIHRNALAAAIDGEMQTLGDIVKAAVYYEEYKTVYDRYDAIVKADPENYRHSLIKMENYDAPASASHDKLQAHIDTMQSALDFYYDFTVQAALTYASKDTTPVDAYIDLTNLLATEEGVRTIPLADILAAVGNNFVTEYSAAISSYNAAVTAVANAQQIFDDYSTMVDEQTKAAQANGTTPPPHPTWQEDLALRSAFTDITKFKDFVNTELSNYINNVRLKDRFSFTYGTYGGILYDFVTIGIGRTANYYSYWDTVGIGENKTEVKKYALNSNPLSRDGDYDNSALFEAWIEMLGRGTDNAVEKFNSLVQPFVYTYEMYDSGETYFTADNIFHVYTDDIDNTAYNYHLRQSYDLDELFALGYSKEIYYSIEDVNNIRNAYNELKTVYLPKAHDFAKGTVEYYLMETGLVNDDTISYVDTATGETVITTVNTILKGIIDTVFADATKPMADRIETELKTAIGNVAYAEFRMYADELTYALSTDHLVWAYIMEAMADYDNILSQMEDWNKNIKSLEEKGGLHKFTWDEISYATEVITGETYGYIRDREYYGYFDFYLSDGSAFENLVSLYSDKFEYETYHRGGNWRYTPYNLEAPLPELELGLIKLREYQYDDELYMEISKKYTGYDKYNKPYTSWERYDYENIGSDHSFFIRANGSFSPDNGITPLYNLAVNGNKSVQTDRSIMFRNLVKEMKLAKASAEESKHMINLNTLTEYIGKTMYKGDYEYVDEDFKLMTLNDLGQSMVSSKLPETLPETFTYGDVETLIATLDSITNAMDSYKASLRTAFMLWASSANGTKAAYKAVAANYTGTLDDMMADAKLSAGNVYYDAYNYVQQILDKTQQSRELLVTIMAGKPETVTENDTVQAATLKQALLPLAGQLYWGVYGSTFNPFDRVALYSDDSVMGYIYALYIPSGSEYYSVQLDNSYYNIRFRAPATNLMQQAINTAVEGGITFDANVSANTYANAILSDSYAFAIDILLRTNAIDSNVLLQTEEMQRIYNEEFGDVETMGKGSYLKYTLTNESQRQQMSQINDCVRVVFTDTNTGEILAVAKPDALKVPDLSYEEIYGDNPKEDESKYEEIEYVGYLHLCDYTITDSGILYVGDKLDSAAIMPLERNKTTPVTVYVYLDGNDMTNAVASATEHINFDMNLQFASDAELVPAASNLGGEDYDLPSDPVNPTPTPDTPTQPVNPTPTPDATVVASGECGENLTWTLNDAGTLTISGTGGMEDYSLLTETTPWYTYGEQIQNVNIEKGVTRIGLHAFNRLKSLTNVTIPDSVTSIGNGAFIGCDSLKNIIIPDSVTSVTADAFYTILALENTTNLNTITVSGGNPKYCDVDGVLYTKDMKTLVAYPTGKVETNLVIPEGVTNIESYAFNGCTSLTSVTIPNTVTNIGSHVFYNCKSLKSVTIPNTVTSIGYYAFSGCISLTDVTIPDSVTTIGISAFYGCTSLTEVTIPDSVTSIGSSAFYNCKSLTDVTISGSVTSVGGYAFINCESLTNITIPDSVTSIGDYAFDGCVALESVYYDGTEQQWNAIAIDSDGNEPLLNATIHYAM